MAQADGVVANGTGSAVRSDINGQYAALWSNHSGSTEPSSGKVSYQFWADTNTNILKIRNSSNNAWISLFTLAGGIDVDAASNFNEDVTFVGDSSKNALWDKSDGALEFADNAKCTFGAADLSIYHDGTENRVWASLGALDIRTTTTTNIEILTNDSYSIWCEADGMTALYHDGSRKGETTSDGWKVYGTTLVRGAEGGTAQLRLEADEGDNNADKWRLIANIDSSLTLENHYDGSYEKNILAGGAGSVEIFYDNSKKLASSSSGITISDDTTSSPGLLKLDSSGGVSDQVYISFTYGGSDTSNGGIRRDGTSQTLEFYSGSDRRIKKDIVDLPNQLDKINQIQLKSFGYKNDPDAAGRGPIAQDLINIYPNKVSKSGGDDGTGETVPDASEPWTIGTNFTWELIKAVQELSAKVSALEAK